jgi:hypothetical protein
MALLLATAALPYHTVCPDCSVLLATLVCWCVCVFDWAVLHGIAWYAAHPALSSAGYTAECVFRHCLQQLQVHKAGVADKVLF